MGDKVSNVADKLYKGTVDIVSGGMEGEGIVGAMTGQQALRDAEDARKKQEALIAEQEKAVDDKRRLAEGVADERKARMSQNQLLSGKQTGTANTLLGAS